MPLNRVVAGSLLVVARAAVACAEGAAPSATGESEPPGVSATGGAPTGPSQSGPSAVPETLDLEAPLVGGGTFRGAELAGSPVAIWFWARW